MTPAEEDYYYFNKLLEPVLREKLQVNRNYLSPIPRNGHYETSGSFSVFEGKDSYSGKLYWKDWGLADQEGSRPVHLAMRLHGLTYEEAEALLEGDEIPQGIEIKRTKKYKLTMYDREELTPSELYYWLTYGIHQDTLRLFNVRGVDRLTAGQNIIYDFQESRPTFSYRGGPNLEYWQWYSPEPKDFFRKGSFILGWDQLPQVGDNLVLVSGLKDGMAFYEASGLPILAGSGETAWRQIKPHLKGLQKRFKNIRTLFDPDSAGVISTMVFKKELDLSPLPFKYPDMRDVASLSKDFGTEYLAKKIFEAL